MERRRLLLAGLFGAVATALAAAPAAAAVTAVLRPAALLPTPSPEAALARPDDSEALLHDVQYGPPRRGHRPRCWVQRRRIAVRGRNGRIHYRWVDRRVCR